MNDILTAPFELWLAPEDWSDDGEPACSAVLLETAGTLGEALRLLWRHSARGGRGLVRVLDARGREAL